MKLIQSRANFLLARPVSSTDVFNNYRLTLRFRGCQYSDSRFALLTLSTKLDSALKGKRALTGHIVDISGSENCIRETLLIVTLPPRVIILRRSLVERRTIGLS